MTKWVKRGPFYTKYGERWAIMALEAAPNYNLASCNTEAKADLIIEQKDGIDLALTALLRYGVHKPGCAFLILPVLTCTCEFRYAVSKLLELQAK